MGVEKLTLFEIHLDDAAFGPTFSTADEDGESPASESADEAAVESGFNPAIPVLAVLALVLLFVAVRKLRGGEDGTEVDVELTE